MNTSKQIYKYEPEGINVNKIIDKSVVGEIKFIGSTRRFNDKKFFIRRIVLDIFSLKNSKGKKEFEFLLIASTPKQIEALNHIKKDDYIVANLKYYDVTTNYDRKYIHAYEFISLMVEE